MSAFGVHRQCRGGCLAFAQTCSSLMCYRGHPPTNPRADGAQGACRHYKMRRQPSKQFHRAFLCLLLSSRLECAAALLKFFCPAKLAKGVDHSRARARRDLVCSYTVGTPHEAPCVGSHKGESYGRYYHRSRLRYARIP